LINLKKAFLIIDRGSREPEVRDELKQVCSIVERKAGYHYSDFCFLEVIPPFIDEGIRKCRDSGAECITVVPYFLYPGMKLKESVTQCARICHLRKLKMVITKPLSYHSVMARLIIDRITALKKEKDIIYTDLECDVLIIGHGSSDKNARDAFRYTVNELSSLYRAVRFCFLELDEPGIRQGIESALNSKPKVLILMPYFLHKGVHIKRDVIVEVNEAVKKYGFENAFMARHLGVDENLVNLLIERAREAEQRRIGFA
jgi:precorrin-8X/cobalt-precorrin-8 methylmutase